MTATGFWGKTWNGTDASGEEALDFACKYTGNPPLPLLGHFGSDLWYSLTDCLWLQTRMC